MESDLKTSWAHLKVLANTREGHAMLRHLLNDIRLRYELDTPQTVINADGSLNQALTWRKAAAYELHQIFADLVPEDKAASYKPNL